MTRIFEALKKAQGQAAALPFPPAAEPPLPRAAVMPRPAAAAATAELRIAPAIGVVPTTPLPDEVVREMTALRIGLESALETRTTRIVMFLGSMSGEGATTIASQFATVVAADGRGRTLLLDAQGSRGGAPHVGSRAAGARRDARASSAGRGGQPLSVASVSDEIRRAGGRAPAALRAFLASLSAQFDWVIVDGAPVLDSPETVDFAPLVDGVVLVIRAGRTKRPVLVRAVDLLRKSGARVLGSVLNRRRFEIPDFIYRRV
jgi:Mrp family chromosome partitioning ATPase